MAGLVAVLVVLPWMERGWLLLLDWTPGPHQPMPRTAWGLDASLPAALPFTVGVRTLSEVVGAATVGWLVIAAALAIAFFAAGRLIGGTALRRVAAGALYAVNPVVFERMFAGQVAYLLAYAFLPLFVASELRWRDDVSWKGMRPALWLALLIALAPHFFWIASVALMAHLVASRMRRRALAWTGLVVCASLALSAYLVVPAAGRAGPVRVGDADLAAFRTQPDRNLGLAVNVAGLYGFWRTEPKLPKEDVVGWPMFLGAIGVLAVFGLRRARRDPGTRHLAGILAVSAGAGFFLALGDQGPTGSLFRWLFRNVPGFDVLREPQKFVALLALGYAVGFGVAVDDLARRATGRRALGAVSALAVLLPALYTPTLFFGLGGRVQIASYPASWSKADDLMGEGHGRLLFLPWHQYLRFPFTGRVIANPADSFFRRETIVGDNVELPDMLTASRLQRSAYLEFLFSRGSELCAFGELVRPLGVEYVALAKTVDFAAYSWLERQPDLAVVLDAPEFTLYRNTRYRGVGWRAGALGRVEHWGALASLANARAVGDAPYVVDSHAPGPIAGKACPPPPSPHTSSTSDVRRVSPVTYEVASGEPGHVVVGEIYDSTWRLTGRRPVELASGMLAFPSDGRAGTASFRHWNVVRIGYLLSMTMVAVVIGGPRLANKQESCRRRRANPSSDPPARAAAGALDDTRQIGQTPK